MSSVPQLRIKVCGMREQKNLAEVATLHPDYIGLIFYRDSPRFVGAEFSLGNARSKDIRYVGVFVNEQPKVILERAKRVGFDHVQLHGDESPQECAVLKSAGLSVIKVFSVGEQFDFSVTAEYAGHVDYFLFDTKGLLYGGNSRTFDWSLLSAYDQRVPFFLSGGLSPENIMAVQDVRHLNLYALDLNSGVEERPGVKSLNKLKDVFGKLGRQF
jgi:phosphoribosylanthranilate isomerase